MKETLQLSLIDCMDVMSALNVSDIDQKRKEELLTKVSKIMTQKSLPMKFTQKIGEAEFQVMIHAGESSEVHVYWTENDGIISFNIGRIEYRFNINSMPAELREEFDATGYITTLPIQFNLSEELVDIEMDIFLLDEEFGIESQFMMISSEELSKRDILIIQ